MSDIVLDGWQKEFLETKGDKILASGRQCGKSLICSLDCVSWALNNPKQNILIGAPTERQAYELFLKVLNYLLQHYKNEIKMGKDKPTQTKICLKNGTVIYCLPLSITGAGVRGFTIGRLYLDESSRLPDEVFNAIYPALLVTGGDTILLSTFNGTQGEFYNTWINKDGAYDSFTRFTVSSEDVVNNRAISESWTQKTKEKALIKLEQAKARLSKKLYAQEYLGIPSEDLLRFFPSDLIKKCCVLQRRAKKNRPFCGIDLARMGEDATAYSVVEKIDNQHFEQLECITTRKTTMFQTFEKLKELNTSYDFKQIGIDSGSGSMGVGFLDFCLQEPELRYRVVALNNRSRVMDFEGDKAVRLLKEDMYQNLKAMMEHGTIKLLDDDEVILSLSSVQFDVKIKEGETRNAIFSHTNSDIVESLIRACQLANEDKSLNLWCEYS